MNAPCGVSPVLAATRPMEVSGRRRPSRCWLAATRRVAQIAAQHAARGRPRRTFPRGSIRGDAPRTAVVRDDPRRSLAAPA